LRREMRKALGKELHWGERRIESGGEEDPRGQKVSGIREESDGILDRATSVSGSSKSRRFGIFPSKTKKIKIRKGRFVKLTEEKGGTHRCSEGRLSRDLKTNKLLRRKAAAAEE